MARSNDNDDSEDRSNILASLMPTGGGLLGLGASNPAPREPQFFKSLEEGTKNTIGAVGNYVDRLSTSAGRVVRNIGAAVMKTEHAVGSFIGNFNVDRAVSTLNANAHSCSQEKCATYVRKALESGGIDLSGRPIAAADYKDFMNSKGFDVAAEGHGLNLSKNYVPQKGDVCVWGRLPGHDSGHICMFNGSQWVSDFGQRDIAGGSAYRAEGKCTVYRFRGEPGAAPSTKLVASAKPTFSASPST